MAGGDAAAGRGAFESPAADEGAGGAAVDAAIAANATTAVEVEAIARSNGLTPVTVEIRTPLGSEVAEPVELTARVNNLTGLGRVVTVGLLLVLATWWLTYFKRRRRARREQRVGESVTRHPAGTIVDTQP